MLQYRLDSEPVNDTAAHLRDMSGVLKEIAVTYRILQETIQKQGAALSSPSIDAYRAELLQLIEQGIANAETINDRSQKLAVVGEQANKHLMAFEKHFSSTLQKHA